MRNVLLVFCLLLPTVSHSEAARKRLPLRVLVLANNEERRDNFDKFFSLHFKQVTVATHAKLNDRLLDQSDVVVLDWSQQEANSRTAKSPLGERDKWTKPTLLLGSAGHLLASPWEVHGGSG